MTRASGSTGKTLAERIQESYARRGVTRCAACGQRHDGAAWNVKIGWHDKQEAAHATH